MHDPQMIAHFRLGTDAGLSAFLLGLLEVLMGTTLDPQDGDSPETLALKERGRAYRERAGEMLKRQSEIDEPVPEVNSRDNALAFAIGGAFSDGVSLSELVAPTPPLSTEEEAELVDEIVKVLETNPELGDSVRRLHGEEGSDM